MSSITLTTSARKPTASRASMLVVPVKAPAKTPSPSIRRRSNRKPRVSIEHRGKHFSTEFKARQKLLDHLLHGHASGMDADAHAESHYSARIGNRDRNGAQSRLQLFVDYGKHDLARFNYFLEQLVAFGLGLRCQFLRFDAFQELLDLGI